MVSLTDTTVVLPTARKNDDTGNAAWRLCNSACVDANSIGGRNCDFVRWKKGWGECRLRRWLDGKAADVIDKRLDKDSVYSAEIIVLQV